MGFASLWLKSPKSWNFQEARYGSNASQSFCTATEPPTTELSGSDTLREPKALQFEAGSKR